MLRADAVLDKKERWNYIVFELSKLEADFNQNLDSEKARALYDAILEKIRSLYGEKSEQEGYFWFLRGW